MLFTSERLWHHPSTENSLKLAAAHGLSNTSPSSVPTHLPARYFAKAERVRRERQLNASMSATWRSEGASTALAQLCSTLMPMSLQCAR